MGFDSRDATILAGGAALGGMCYWAIASHKRRKLAAANTIITQPADAEVQLSPLPHNGSTQPPATPQATLDIEHDDIVAEQLTRNVQFFGKEGQRKISDAFVVVVGLGGVGSHAAHLLLRSGVGRLRLIDFDQVTLSSLNRHCLATRHDVGLPKATCLARHFKDILPEAKVEILCEMYNDETEEAALSGNPDFVLDAIDNIDTKVALLAACKRRNIPVLCVAGAGAKADPTRLRFVDVAESSVDPLARAVRQRLRQDFGIEHGIQILLSTEKPRCGLVYGGDGDTSMLDYQVVPNFRVRTIPVLGTTPAIFGLAAAGHILCELAGAPFTPEPVFKILDKAVKTQFDRWEERENERGGDALGVDIQEVEILVRELWRGMSARADRPPHAHTALTRGIGHLVLTRWDPSKPGTVDNLVLLTKEEADAHDAAVQVPGGFEALKEKEPEFAHKVERVLSRARREFQYSYY